MTRSTMGPIAGNGISRIDLDTHWINSTLNHRSVRDGEYPMQINLKARPNGPGLGVTAKVAIALADDRPIALIFPASRRVVLDRLRKLLGADEVCLSPPGEVDRILGDGETRPSWPLPEMRGISLLIDASLWSARSLEVQTREEETTVRLTLEDWLSTASPGLGFFTEPDSGRG